MSSSPSPRKIYTDLLLSKELGYPLYYPEPYRNALRRGWSGVSVGDVGIINSDGGFDFQFNVVKKPDVLPDPTSQQVSVANGLPLHPELSFRNELPQFRPIELEDTEIRYNDNDCHPGKVIGRYITHTLSVDGKMLLHIPPSPIRTGLTFNIECSREKAASLILPNGATRVDVVDEQLGKFYDLARQHGASWLGLFPFTGPSLCLVTGCVKTNSWALMSLYNSSKTTGLSLKFGVGSGPSWTWLETGPADTRHSPETDDSNRNHCVFLRGIRISKRDHKWPFRRKGELVHLNDLGTGERYPINTEGSSTSGSTTQTHLASTSTGSSTSNTGGQHGAGQAAFKGLSLNVDGDNTGLKSMSAPDIGTEDQSDDDIVIEPLTEVSVSNHPSEIINQRLLHENPSAEFAITHDDQWANVLQEGDMPLDEESLWLQMLEKNNVIVESSCVFFVDKGISRSNPESHLIAQFDRLPQSQDLVNDPRVLITDLVRLVGDYKSVGTIAANMPVVLSGLLSGGTHVQHDSIRILEFSAHSFYGELTNAAADAVPSLVECVLSSDEAATQSAALDGLKAIVDAHKDVITRALFGTLPSLVKVLSGEGAFQIRGLEVFEIIAGSPHCTPVAAIVPDIVQCLSSHTSVQLAALKVLEAGARSKNNKLAEAVAVGLASPQFMNQHSSSDRRVSLLVMRILEAGAGTKNDKLAEAVALNLHFIETFSSSDNGVWVGVMKVLEASARSKNNKLVEMVALVLQHLIHQCHSYGNDVELASLKLLEAAAESENSKLTWSAALALLQFILLLSSDDSGVWLAVMKMLEDVARSKNYMFADLVAVSLPQVIKQSFSRGNDIQLGAMKVLKVGAGSKNDKLAEAVVPILPEVVEHLSSDDRRVQLDALKVLEAGAGSANDKLAKAIALVLPQVIEKLSSCDEGIPFAAQRVLEAAAGSWNRKLAEAVVPTLPRVIEQISSSHSDVQLAALKVLEAGAGSKNDKLAEAVAPTLPQVMKQSSSSDNVIQLAVMKVLEAGAGSKNDKLAEAVAHTLPQVVEQLSSSYSHVQIAVLGVLEAGARSVNDELAEAVASILPQVVAHLFSGVHCAGLKVLEAGAGSTNLTNVVASVIGLGVEVTRDIWQILKGRKVPPRDNIFHNKFQSTALKVLEAGAGTENDKLAEAVALAVRQVIQLSSSDSEVQLAELKVLESGAGSKNGQLAKAVALKLPFIEKSFSRDNSTQIAALKVLEAGARSKNDQLAEAVSLRLIFIEKFFSGDILAQLAALGVLEAGGGSENENLIEAVAVVLTSRFMDFSKQISSRNSEVQLAALEVLKTIGGSNHVKLVKLVMRALPHLEELRSSHQNDMEILVPVQAIITQCKIRRGGGRF